MREILFRGKRITKRIDDIWVEGSLLHYEDGDCDICSPSGIPGELLKYAVHPSTVGQFTGKTDNNGIKVFEDDILQLYTVWADGTREKSAKVIVQWWENDQCYVLTTKEGHHCDDFGNYGRPEYYEVIGNIHDNPELLENP